MQIEFSEIAKKTLAENIEFLKRIWTNREVVIFLEDVKRITNDLENGKYSFPSQDEKCFNRQKTRKNVLPKGKRD